MLSTDRSETETLNSQLPACKADTLPVELSPLNACRGVLNIQRMFAQHRPKRSGDLEPSSSLLKRQVRQPLRYTGAYAPDRDRTCDIPVKSRLPYHLATDAILFSVFVLYAFVSFPLSPLFFRWTTRGLNPPSQVCKTRVTPLRPLALTYGCLINGG